MYTALPPLLLSYFPLYYLSTSVHLWGSSFINMQTLKCCSTSDSMPCSLTSSHILTRHWKIIVRKFVCEAKSCTRAAAFTSGFERIQLKSNSVEKLICFMLFNALSGQMPTWLGVHESDNLINLQIRLSSPPAVTAWYEQLVIHRSKCLCAHEWVNVPAAFMCATSWW